MNPLSNRRRFQFSLRTMLIGVTLLAIPCGYIGQQVKIVRDRKAWLAAHPKANRYSLSKFAPRYAGRDPEQTPSRLRLWLGDVDLAQILLQEPVSDADVHLAESLFPDAEIMGIPEADIHGKR